MMPIPKHIEIIARAIAIAHGSQFVLHRDGQNLTRAALSGFGSWGHSADDYTEQRWHEYVGAARAVSLLPPFMPPHKACCTIQHNDHLSNYSTVTQEMKHNPDWFVGAWVSDESRDYAIEHNELWSLQWYPESPVGFNNLCAGRWEDIVAHFPMSEIPA